MINARAAPDQRAIKGGKREVGREGANPGEEWVDGGRRRRRIGHGGTDDPPAGVAQMRENGAVEASSHAAAGRGETR